MRTCVMSFSKAIDPDHDISDHHYYDNYTVYSYYCSNYYSTAVAITIATIYIKQCNMQPGLGKSALYVSFFMLANNIVNTFITYSRTKQQ